VKQDWSWAVEHYDWIRKPYGDAYPIPTALANEPKWARLQKFFRCFGEGCEGRVQCLLAGLSSHQVHWTAIWGTTTNGSGGMDASAMVCKYCSRANGERADRDGGDMEVLDLDFEDFSNDKADLNVAQQYFKDQIEDCRALWDARWNAKSDACRALWDAKQLPPNCTTPRGFG